MKILLVENSFVVRERLRRLTAAIPHAVLVAECGSDIAARRHLASHRPALVILDPCLRGGSGFALIAQIKTVLPSAIIVVLTNLVHPEYRARCMALGADHFLDKSKETQAFIALITALCLARSVSPNACTTCCHDG